MRSKDRACVAKEAYLDYSKCACCHGKGKDIDKKEGLWKDPREPIDRTRCPVLVTPFASKVWFRGWNNGSFQNQSQSPRSTQWSAQPGRRRVNHSLEPKGALLRLSLNKVCPTYIRPANRTQPSQTQSSPRRDERKSHKHSRLAC